MAVRTVMTRSALAALLLALAACGRAGPLEPPPASATATTGQAADPEPAPADRGFILDPLIE
ncbi:MAG: lipoprotein [Roseitalea porphyridii]|uniref:Argininosuccinate lyase n=1 Tax=Roseitalea porphyridii TaxID=1852022 RepID=A0A4P6UXZ7_9HYPH|nr:lipoprotein [Roseitalea porphyridii]QBK29184.1 hypothetical protein E0E05_00395 [Roseitalea porphyridii]